MRYKRLRDRDEQFAMSGTRENKYVKTVIESSDYVHSYNEDLKKNMLINGMISAINRKNTTETDQLLNKNCNQEKSSQNNRWESSMKSSYQIYKASGDWWNVFPKTDYTYAKSSTCRKEIAPGVLPMPNMSRRSLHSYSDRGYSANSSVNSSYHTYCGEDIGDFADTRQTSYHEENRSVVTKIFISIWTYLSYIYRKVTLQDHHLGLRSPPFRSTSVAWSRSTRTSWYKKLEVLFYQTACYFLLMDVWFLSCFSKLIGRRESQQRHSKLLFLLLIPPLLLAGLWFLGNSEEIVVIIPKRNSLKEVPIDETNIGQHKEKSIISGEYDINLIVQKVLSSPGIRTVLDVQHTLIKGMEENSLLSTLQLEKNQLELNLEQKEKLLLKQEEDYLNLTAELHNMRSQLEELKMELKQKNEQNLEVNNFHQMLRHHTRRLEHKIQLAQKMTTCCQNIQPKVTIDNYITEYLSDILNFDNQGKEKTQENVRLWVKNILEAKNDLEARLANITANINLNIEEASERSAQTIMSSVVEQLRHEFQHKELCSCDQQSNVENIYISPSCSNCSLTAEHVQKIVANALNRYDADKTGMVDYALETSGGTVINTRCTENYDSKSPAWSWLGINFPWSSNHPRIVIQPGIHPGKCWAFRGAQGYLVIALSAQIKITAFSIEHIPKSLSPTGNIDSAPKHFSVWGLEQELDKNPVLLGKYEYQENGTSLQFFPIQALNAQPYQMVELRIESNHGNLEYTCLYRFRVHGILANK